MKHLTPNSFSAVPLASCSLAVYLFTVSLLAGCDDGSALKRNPGSATASVAAALNPLLAKVTLTAAQLVPASEGSTIQVPGFSISLSNANYVEILRCTSDYNMAVPDGTLIEKVTTKLDVRRSQMKWAWNNAKNARANCSIVAINTGRSSFADLAASNGSWKYHAVGCVSTSLLKDNQKTEPCNYEIASTNAVDYDGQLRTDFLNKAQDFATADGRLFGVLTELYRLAEKIRIDRDICKVTYQQKKYLEEATAGALNLLKSVLNVASAVFTGGAAAAVLGNIQTGFKLLDLAGANLTPTNTEYTCPEADFDLKQIDGLREEYTSAVEGMIKIRKELAELDGRYVAMGDMVEEEFNKLKSGQTSGGTSKEAPKK